MNRNSGPLSGHFPFPFLSRPWLMYHSVFCFGPVAYSRCFLSVESYNICCLGTGFSHWAQRSPGPPTWECGPAPHSSWWPNRIPSGGCDTSSFAHPAVDGHRVVSILTIVTTATTSSGTLLRATHRARHFKAHVPLTPYSVF